MKIYKVDAPTIERLVNSACNELLDELREQGHLDDMAYDNYRYNYAFILRKPSFFNEVWQSVIHRVKDPMLILVQQISLKREEEPIIEDDITPPTIGSEHE